LFLASKPGMSPVVGGPFHVGYAAAIFAVGAITGLVAARWLARALRPPAVKQRRR
jgi:membrane associated rhomboid family serine protease